MAIDYATTPRIYVPGDPRTTRYVDQLWTIANVIERSTRYYLTAKHYADVIAEMRAQYDVPEGKPAPGHLLFGKEPCLTVVNSGTDDQGLVNRMNEKGERDANFQARAAKFRTS